MQFEKEPSDFEFTVKQGKFKVDTVYNKFGKIRNQEIYKNGKKIRFMDLTDDEKKYVPNDFKDAEEMMKAFAKGKQSPIPRK